MALAGAEGAVSTAAKTNPPGLRLTLAQRAFEPWHIAGLVFFRVGFGVLMMWEVWRYFDHGWIPKYWIEPEFFFTYYGFSWVKPWAGNWMYVHFYVLGVLAFMIAVGFLYRLAATLFFLAFTYAFLLEQARYLNHFYFICLLSFLVIFVPAHRAFSIDALFLKGLRSNTVPAWSYWVLRLQLGVVYFFGGVAKLNGDWLVGEPMRNWMARDPDFPLIGRFFREEWMVYLVSYGGLLFDLLIVPFLLWRRTRIPAFIAAIAFHVINLNLFHIGVFPWLGMAATTIFFVPHWPLKLWAFLTRKKIELPVSPSSPLLTVRQKLVFASWALYAAFQVLFPLRHWLYPGDVNWTQEGHRFSWRMKLNDKSERPRYYVTDPQFSATWEIFPDTYLTRVQLNTMPSRPDMILQFAHYISKKLTTDPAHPIQFRADILMSLNGRKYVRYLDPKVDLAAEPRTLWPAKWILPLDPTLKPSERRMGRRGKRSIEKEDASESSQ